MNRSTPFKVMGGTIIVVGLYMALVPFVGPTFGYTMPAGADVPAWEWNASHFQRHVIPGVVAIIAGALLWHRSRPVTQGGSWLALAAGAWMVVSPFVPRAWLDGGMMGGGGEASTTMQIITPLGYHHVPGMITLGLAAFALGLLFAHRLSTPTRERPVRPAEDGRSPRQPERERQPVAG